MAIDQTKLNPELTQWLAARQSALKIVQNNHHSQRADPGLDSHRKSGPDGKDRVSSGRYFPAGSHRRQGKAGEGRSLSSLTTRKSSAARRERFPSCARISRS